MAKHSLYPAFVRIFYESPRGKHVMTRPTREHMGEPWAGPGSYLSWIDDSELDADEMINGLITLMLPLYTDDVQFTQWIIYTMDEPDSFPVPVWAENLTGQIGAITDTVEYLAFAKTYTYLTSANNTAKLVLLDVPTGGVISKTNILPAGDELDLVNYLKDRNNAFCGRDNSELVVWRSLSNDVNDALQKQYRI